MKHEDLADGDVRVAITNAPEGLFLQGKVRVQVRNGQIYAFEDIPLERLGDEAFLLEVVQRILAAIAQAGEGRPE